MEFCFKLNSIFYYKLKRNDEDKAYILLERAIKEKKYEFVYLFMDYGIDISKLKNFECLINVGSF
jgi:hypothetical protein